MAAVLGAWWARCVHLMRQRRVAAEDAAWLRDCELLQTLDVQTALDVVFVDAHGQVQRVVTYQPKPDQASKNSRASKDAGIPL